MWHSAFAFIKYLITSDTKYGVHSPFVYDFITKAIGNSLPKVYTKKLQAYRKSLLEDSEVIVITDYGAGSKVFNSNSRKVSDIAKYAGISKNKATFFQKILYYYKPKNILELGTSLGIGTASISIVLPNAQITSIEGCSNTAKKAAEYFERFNLKNINIKIGKFSDLLPKIYQNNHFDLIYFDGNHQKEATITYFIDSLQSVHNDTILIFDDIHWSKGMEEAWNFIKEHKKVRVSIDLFHVGLVFFRKEQVKQHFILR